MGSLESPPTLEPTLEPTPTHLLYVFLRVALSVAVTLVITIPLAGVLVRYRANHNPKAVQLDAEDGVPVHTGPIVNGYFAMMKRVYKMEGWGGLYKGTMPTLLSATIVLALGTLVFYVARPDSWKDTQKVAKLEPLAMFVYSLGSLLFGLPTTVLTYRSMVTPYKLPFFGMKRSLRVLLTPAERHRPWILYLTPGLLVAEALSLSLFSLGLTPLQRLLLPSEIHKGNVVISPLKLAIYLVVVVFSTSIFTPLEVIITRLAIQRNHRSSDNDVVPAEELATYIGPEAEEAVLNLRSEADPYLSFVDCIKRLTIEEGWGSLFRAWWWTTIGILAGGIVA